MDLHQMQVAYDLRADRLLWQLRTRDGALYAVWLTRRMVARLWPPFQQLVMAAALPTAGGGPAIAVPEAREMLAEMARQRPLPGADFQQPFDAHAVSRPLGPEPLLPDTIELVPLPPAQGKGLVVKLREQGGRSLDLRLGEDLATALLRLVDKAVAGADWFAPAARDGVPLPEAGGPSAPPTFN